MGQLIGQPLKDIRFEMSSNERLRIIGLLFFDPETDEDCEYVPPESGYIKLVRTPHRADNKENE